MQGFAELDATEDSVELEIFGSTTVGFNWLGSAILFKSTESDDELDEKELIAEESSKIGEIATLWFDRVVGEEWTFNGKSLTSERSVPVWDFVVDAWMDTVDPEISSFEGAGVVEVVLIGGGVLLAGLESFKEITWASMIRTVVVEEVEEVVWGLVVEEIFWGKVVGKVVLGVVVEDAVCAVDDVCGVIVVKIGCRGVVAVEDELSGNVDEEVSVELDEEDTVDSAVPADASDDETGDDVVDEDGVLVIGKDLFSNVPTVCSVVTGNRDDIEAVDNDVGKSVEEKLVELWVTACEGEVVLCDIFKLEELSVIEDRSLAEAVLFSKEGDFVTSITGGKLVLSVVFSSIPNELEDVGIGVVEEVLNREVVEFVNKIISVDVEFNSNCGSGVSGFEVVEEIGEWDNESSKLVEDFMVVDSLLLSVDFSVGLIVVVVFEGANDVVYAVGEEPAGEIVVVDETNSLSLILAARSNSGKWTKVSLTYGALVVSDWDTDFGVDDKFVSDCGDFGRGLGVSITVSASLILPLSTELVGDSVWTVLVSFTLREFSELDSVLKAVVVVVVIPEIIGSGVVVVEVVVDVVVVVVRVVFCPVEIELEEPSEVEWSESEVVVVKGVVETLLSEEIDSEAVELEGVVDIVEAEDVTEEGVWLVETESVLSFFSLVVLTGFSLTLWSLIGEIDSEVVELDEVDDSTEVETEEDFSPAGSEPALPISSFVILTRSPPIFWSLFRKSSNR